VEEDWEIRANERTKAHMVFVGVDDEDHVDFLPMGKHGTAATTPKPFLEPESDSRQPSQSTYLHVGVGIRHMELVRAVLERLSGHIADGYRLEPVAVKEQSRELRGWSRRQTRCHEIG
jgi:hypothetical protein